MNEIEDLYQVKDSTYFSSVRSEIFSLLPNRLEKVLEIGCGTGSTLCWLKKNYGAKWIAGVELNIESVRIAAQNLDLCLQGNIEKMELPLEKNSLDLILCLDVLEHLVDPWSVVSLLREYLKPGGVIIVSIPNILHVSALLPLIFYDRWDYQKSGILDITHLRFFTKKTSIELLANTGLVVDMSINYLPSKKRSKTWYFNLLTLNIFKRYLTTQFLIRGVNV